MSVCRPLWRAEGDLRVDQNGRFDAADMPTDRDGVGFRGRVVFELVKTRPDDRIPGQLSTLICFEQGRFPRRTDELLVIEQQLSSVRLEAIGGERVFGLECTANIVTGLTDMAEADPVPAELGRYRKFDQLKIGQRLSGSLRRQRRSRSFAPAMPRGDGLGETCV